MGMQYNIWNLVREGLKGHTGWGQPGATQNQRQNMMPLSLVVAGMVCPRPTT